MYIENRNLVKLEMVQGKPFVASVKVTWEPDEYPDFSYLEELASENNVSLGVSDEEHAGQDRQYAKKRMKDYGRWWEYVSCHAVAEVAYRISEQGDFRLQRFTSAGLYGIESDNPDEYFANIEVDELTDLKQHLERFGVLGLGMVDQEIARR